MEKQQTAVDWLVNQLEKHYVNQNIKDTTVFLRAIQMEKEQIINTFKEAQGLHALSDETRAEQFFKNTFVEG